MLVVVLALSLIWVVEHSHGHRKILRRGRSRVGRCPFVTRSTQSVLTSHPYKCPYVHVLSLLYEESEYTTPNKTNNTHSYVSK